MVSISKSGNSDIVAVLELIGLSTDDKPVGEIDGYRIPNGSQFLAMDTSQVFMYDEENQKWYEL